MIFYFVKIYLMKKNKIIINNNLNKLKKLVPTLAMLGMLNCNVCHPMTLQKTETSKLVQSISLSQQSLSYNSILNHSDQQSIKTLKAILSSDLNKFKIDEKITDEEIQKEINHHLSEMNANTLKLARLYKSLEDHTITKSGLSVNEIYQASNHLTFKVEALHYVHTTLDRLNLIRSHADEDSLNSIFKLYKKENLAFQINSANDVREKTNLILYDFKEDIRNFTNTVVTENNENDSSLADEIYSAMNELDYLITQTEYTQANSKYIYYLINKTAELLYSTKMFGTYSMCRDLVIEYATHHGINTIITNLEFFGYDLEGLGINPKTKNLNKSNVVLNNQRQIHR